MTQPQPMPDGRHIVVSTQAGLALIGPRRDTETLIWPDFQDRAYTTPFPLARRHALVRVDAARRPTASKVDLGLYRVRSGRGQAGIDLQRSGDGRLRGAADPAPAARRRLRPPEAETRRATAAGSSAAIGVRHAGAGRAAARPAACGLIEGVPVVGRHSTQTESGARLEEPRRHVGPRAGHRAAGRRTARSSSRCPPIGCCTCRCSTATGA